VVEHLHRLSQRGSARPRSCPSRTRDNPTRRVPAHDQLPRLSSRKRLSPRDSF
jgi:hypothetical protein